MSNPTSFSKTLAPGVTLHMSTNDTAISFLLETSASDPNRPGNTRKIQLSPELTHLVITFFELPGALSGAPE